MLQRHLVLRLGTAPQPEPEPAAPFSNLDGRALLQQPLGSRTSVTDCPLQAWRTVRVFLRSDASTDEALLQQQA